MLNFLKRHNWSIDIGSSQIRVCCDGLMVLDEPTIVLTNKNGSFIDAGEDVWHTNFMFDHIYHRPISSREIQDYELMWKMLGYLWKKCNRRKVSTMYCSYPSTFLDVEKRALKEIIEAHMCRKAVFVGSSEAATWYLGLNSGYDEYGNKRCGIIDIGEGGCDFTIVQNGEIILQYTMRGVGGEAFDFSTLRALRDERGVYSNVRLAKFIKESYGNDEIYKGVLGHDTDGKIVKSDFPYVLVRPYYDEIINKIIFYIEEQY